VRVTRVVDAATRPLDYRQKFGFGLSPAGFKKSAGDGAIGQLGLRESLFMIGDTLGWRLEEIVETIEPVVAKRRVRTAFFSLGKHEVIGLRQKAEGFVSGRSVICLDLEVSLGARNPRDEIAIDASPPISVTIPGGIEEGAATAAVMVNCLTTIAHGNGVGLLSMRDMPIAPYRNPQIRLSEDQPQELVTKPPTAFTDRSPGRRTG
jgi:4-hydroxy-tetrahydrodipicolinate reductase